MMKVMEPKLRAVPNLTIDEILREEATRFVISKFYEAHQAAFEAARAVLSEVKAGPFLSAGRYVSLLVPQMHAESSSSLSSLPAALQPIAEDLARHLVEEKIRGMFRG